MDPTQDPISQGEEVEVNGEMEAGASGIGPFEQFYLDNGNDKATLLAAAYGLKSQDKQRTIDWMDEPYASMKERNCIPKVKQHLQREIKRRHEAMGWSKTKSKCTSFTAAQCRERLKKYPIADPQDLAFIQRTEQVFYDLIVSRQKQREEAARIRLAQANWTGNLPYLRLYCCVCHSRAREALIRRTLVLDKDELDAGVENDAAPDSFEQVVADLYNDRSMVFETEILPRLHMEFAESFTLRFEDMPGGEITPGEVKIRYGDARAKLVKLSSTV
ncbi:MAG: hypothetical protein SGARI_001998 [Bacillariaceae sp.]